MEIKNQGAEMSREDRETLFEGLYMLLGENNPARGYVDTTITQDSLSGFKGKLEELAKHFGGAAVGFKQALDAAGQRATQTLRDKKMTAQEESEWIREQAKKEGIATKTKKMMACYYNAIEIYQHLGDRAKVQELQEAMVNSLF